LPPLVSQVEGGESKDMHRNDRGTRIPVRRGDGQARLGNGVDEEETGVDRVEGADIDEQIAPQPADPAAAALHVNGSELRDDVDWRETALRLRAEMENFRKRQKRWAEDEVRREQQEFLRPFLGVVDDLEQALKHIDLNDPAHRGVRVVYEGAMGLLMRQGVERIAAEGQLFDPNIHQAVAVIPVHEAGIADMHVVAVTLPGYTYAEHLLRPAQVIVAKQNA
jgi:molecular chaperone GrpE